MLFSLPPEILRQIIESTVPHHYHSRTHEDRQKTLSSLCLVSHLFRDIAQPLLREVIYLSGDRLSAELSIDAASPQSRGQDVRQVIMDCQPGDYWWFLALDQIVSTFPRLAALAVCDTVGGEVKLEALTRLSGGLYEYLTEPREYSKVMFSQNSEIFT